LAFSSSAKLAGSIAPIRRDSDLASSKGSPRVDPTDWEDRVLILAMRRSRALMKLSQLRPQDRPFSTTPDPRFYYAASPHEAALERLRRAIDDGEGLMLLTGEPGTGKTLLAHLLLDRLGGDINSALLTNCRFASRGDLFRALLFDLGRPYQTMGEQELRLALAEYLLEQFAKERRTVLILDEAQGLTPDLLEELRLLGNLEAGGGKAVQIVLIAQSTILETLALPELTVLNQRLSVRMHLDPLDLHESVDYLLHQLRQAGLRPERAITDEALSVLGKNAQGVPRLLNRYTRQAMTLAEQAEADTVDVEAALEALEQLGVSAEPAEDEFPTRPTLAGELNEANSPSRITTAAPVAAPRTPLLAPPLPASAADRARGPAPDPAWYSGAMQSSKIDLE
jgi:general secretion pathway protein A